MKRVFAWVLGGLPFDARSRRAIDETLLDWEGEATEARTFAEATGAEIHGVASIVRVASLSMLRESIDFGWVRGLGRRFVVAGATVVLLAGVLSVVIAGSLEIDPRAFLFITPILATMAVPATLFLAIAWRPSGLGVPSPGACWGAGLAAVLLTQLLTAVAGQLYYFLIFRDLGTDPPAAGIPVWLQVRVLLGVFALGSFAGAVAVLAASLARRSGLQSRWWLVGIPVISLLVPWAARNAVRFAFGYSGFPELRVYSDVVVYPVLVGALLVLAAKFGRAPRLRGAETT